MPDKLPRPWHGASDRENDAGVQALRLQRAEVDALMVFRRTKPDAPEAAQLWQRLYDLREQRRAMMSAAEAATLQPLPPAPVSLRTASTVQTGGWRRLLGLLGRSGAGGKDAPH